MEITDNCGDFHDNTAELQWRNGILGLLPLRNNDKGFTLLELIIIVVIIGIIAAIAIPQLLSARRSAWENRCKLTLRAIGSAQLTYIETTIENTYGTFEALLETDNIASGYTKGSLIDNYSIIVFDVDPPTMTFGGLPAYDSTFTVIVVPRSQRNRLRTFGINTTQTLRVFVGNESDFASSFGLKDANLWQPVR